MGAGVVDLEAEHTRSEPAGPVVPQSLSPSALRRRGLPDRSDHFFVEPVPRRHQFGHLTSVLPGEIFALTNVSGEVVEFPVTALTSL